MISKLNHDTIIFLTACINPNGMSHTVLQDIYIRKQQYVNALNFYLRQTSLAVCFVENTGYDMSDDFRQYIDSGKLEYLTFEGNNYDKERGKGYGEALILLYGIQHSRLLKNCKYFIKVTGRVIVPEIESISKSCFLKLDNVFRSDILGSDFIRTVIFVSSARFMQRVLSSIIDDITEKEGFIIENLLARELIKHKEINIIPFFRTITINGIFATKNTPYENKPSLVTLRDNLSFWSYLEYKREHYFKSKLIKFIYYLTLINPKR